MSAVKRHFFDLYTTKNDDDIIIEQKRKDMEDRMYKSYLSTLFRVTDGLFALVKTSPSESYSIVINKGLKENQIRVASNNDKQCLIDLCSLLKLQCADDAKDGNPN